MKIVLILGVEGVETARLVASSSSEYEQTKLVFERIRPCLADLNRIVVGGLDGEQGERRETEKASETVLT